MLFERLSVFPQFKWFMTRGYDPGNFFDTLIAGEPEQRWGFLAIKRSQAMSDFETDLKKVTKAVEKQIADTQKKVGDVTLQAQDEFTKTVQEMSQTVMSRARAEIELGAKLTARLSEARSFPDVVSAYQEWLNKVMVARSEDARQFMTNWQKFMTEGTRLFSNGGSIWPTGR